MKLFSIIHRIKGTVLSGWFCATGYFEFIKKFEAASKRSAKLIRSVYRFDMQHVADPGCNGRLWNFGLVTNVKT